MRTIDNLVEHMKKYNDAVFIVGPGAIDKQETYTKEEFNERYTRKKLVREPDDFWKFVSEHMLVNTIDSDKDVFREINSISDVTKLVINQNMVGLPYDNTVHLHGLMTLFMCPKCKTFYPQEYVTSVEPYESTCEHCNATIRPTVLLSGERYVKSEYDRTIAALQNTHTIVLVGMDYSEESLMEQLAQYGDIKTFVNSSNSNEEKMLVVIQDPEEDFDPNEMTFCEFLVKDDVKSAVSRMIRAFQ